ncbi:MAG: alpha/beta fold hydrolase [Anaerolineaceae bacterium]|nr:alpha/beta fold hydrolase [Anaerolineaceae bacterium]
MSQETEARRHKNVVYFKRGELDYVLQTALSTAASDAAAIGEVFYAASRVNEKEKDLGSWIKEWSDLGSRVEKIARDALAKGHNVSAREAYLRAFNYYRIGAYLMRVNDPVYKESVQHFRNCFCKAAALFDPPFEQIEINCEGQKLPGYFIKADKTGKPRRTILFFSGGESFSEEIYIWFGPAALKRGYNLLAIDLPGQGITSLEGIHFRHDVEVPVSAAIDYLLTRPEVDPHSIVASGVSYGGYVTMRAAAHDKRLAAVSASTPLIDFQKMINENAPWLSKVPAFAGDAAVKILGRIDPFAMVVYEKFLDACGFKQPSEAVTGFENWTVDVSQIKCPVLCMVGAGEHKSFQWQAHTAYERLSAEGKTLRVFEVSEGADAHCQANNIPLGSQVVFDWFDEMLQSS